MSDQVMTASTEMAAVIPELWSPSFFPTLLAALPMNESVARSYEGEIRNLGDIVNIPSWPEFDEAEAIVEGQRVDAEAATATSQALTINKEVVKDFIVTNKAMAQSIESMNRLRDLAFYAIMKKMQNLIFDSTVPSASTPDHTIAYDSSATLALADLTEGKGLLDAANVPDDGRRVLVMDTPQANNLFSIAGFTSKDYIAGGNPMLSGALPAMILGFQPKTTSEASAVTYMFHSDYLNMAVQKDLQVEAFNLGVQGTRALRVNSTILFGLKQTGNTRVVSIS